MSCVSIGFAINKQVVVGVVFNPVLNEMFTAIRGEGAYRNGQRIHVSTRGILKVFLVLNVAQSQQHALVATGFPYDRDDAVIDPILARLKKVLKACRGVRRGGSAALDM